LSWRERYEIAKGTANGLQFLHGEFDLGDGTIKTLIHGDIKSANILLDKNLCAKIGDFGIAREVEGDLGKSKYTRLSTIHGTQWYLPEDFLVSKRLTVSVDTYSFGVVLFDMVTGRGPHMKVKVEGGKDCAILEVMKDSEAIPTQHVDSWDGSYKGCQLSKILYAEGMKCTQYKAKQRPKMTQVYEELVQYESHSPTPYELQQQFDSGGNNPLVPLTVVGNQDPSQPVAGNHPQDPFLPLTVGSLSEASTAYLSSQSPLVPVNVVRPQVRGDLQQTANLPNLLDLIPATIMDDGPTSLIPTTVGTSAEEDLIPACIDSTQFSEQYSDQFHTDSSGVTETNSSSTFNSDSTYQDSARETAERIESAALDIADLDIGF